MWGGYYVVTGLFTVWNIQLVQGECPGTETCRPKARCVLSSNQLASSQCDLPSGGKGSCCDDVIGKRRVGISSRTDNPPPKIALRRPQGIKDSDIKLALRSVEEISSGTRGSGGHNFFTQPRKENDDILKAAYKLLYAKVDIGNRQADGINADNSNEINNACIWRHKRKPNCAKVQYSQDGTREYRTADGSCNNVAEPLYGMQGTPLQRIIEPGEYKRFEGLPRKARGGGELPSARRVSNEVFKEGVAKDGDFTHLLMQIGQFLDHDMTHVSTIDPPLGGVDGCCSERNQFDFPVRVDDKERCFPIEVPDDDPLWGIGGSRRERRTCMDFKRSRFSPTLDCKLGAREQENDLTHWLDMSQLYGSTQEEKKNLRDPKESHLLLVTTTSVNNQRLQGRSLLPRCSTQSPREQSLFSNNIRAQAESCRGCRELSDGGLQRCFFGGDIRTNEQPGLATMHTVWVREHNRVAAKLLDQTRSRLSKDDIFEEARRIVIAEWQHIIYQEWLPIIIGKNYMQVNDMLPLSFGYSTGYTPEIDPRINNEFAAAAFRFGHSLVYSTIPQRDSSNRGKRDIDLKSVFDDARNLNEPTFIADTIRGIVGDRMPAMDADFAEDILHNLFEDDLDLPALNIQRGRDHAISGYNKYRAKCASDANGFQAVRTIEELSRDGRISRDAVNSLKKVYNHIDDIDLFVGGILEFFGPHDDALIGPTFLCIIGDQFNRLKRGDRFWYENGEDSSTRFTLRQLDEIRGKANMARILCDNSDIEAIQPLPFQREASWNPRVRCSDNVTIPSLNLSEFLSNL